jgi:hypothetical protein
MTAHVFEINDMKKEATSMFSRLLPPSLGLERSAKHLKIKDELKEELGANDIPYICFIEQSGMLVVLTYNGWCCKFTLSDSQQNPQSAAETTQYVLRLKFRIKDFSNNQY